MTCHRRMSLLSYMIVVLIFLFLMSHHKPSELNKNLVTPSLVEGYVNESDSIYIQVSRFDDSHREHSGQRMSLRRRHVTSPLQSRAVTIANDNQRNLQYHSTGLKHYFLHSHGYQSLERLDCRCVPTINSSPLPSIPPSASFAPKMSESPFQQPSASPTVLLQTKKRGERKPKRMTG